MAAMVNAAVLERTGELVSSSFHPSRSDLSRFFARVEPLRDDRRCWLWLGPFNTSGYGVFWSGEEAASAHRVAYRWFVGEIPTQHDIDHLCRIRACVNPAHLEAVTHDVNIKRGVAARVFCKNGHLWIAANIVPRRAGGRWVQTCRLCLTASRSRELQRQKSTRGGVR